MTAVSCRVGTFCPKAEKPSKKFRAELLLLYYVVGVRKTRVLAPSYHQSVVQQFSADARR